MAKYRRALLWLASASAALLNTRDFHQFIPADSYLAMGSIRSEAGCVVLFQLTCKHTCRAKEKRRESRHLSSTVVMYVQILSYCTYQANYCNEWIIILQQPVRLLDDILGIFLACHYFNPYLADD